MLASMNAPLIWLRTLLSRIVYFIADTTFLLRGPYGCRNRLNAGEDR
jgi:hypothetical protein